MLEYKEVKGWDAKTIDAKVAELRKEYFVARMQKATTGFEKPHRFKEIKKDIARLLTAKGDRR